MYAFQIPRFDYFLRATAKLYSKVQKLGTATKIAEIGKCNKNCNTQGMREWLLLLI